MAISLNQEGSQFMWRLHLVDFAEQFKHPAWGIHHFQRVYNLSLKLADEQNLDVDQDALFAAAYLHDVGSFSPYKIEDVEHSERSTQIVEEILAPLGFQAAKISLVKDIIRGHMFYSEPVQNTEAIIFHDADALDFMGAIGITRLLSLVKIDNWAPDVGSAINLIQKFSKYLPQRLHTLKAQEIAKIRRGEMNSYLAALSDETNGLQVL